MKQKAIICDLDGTLYNAKERQKKHLLSGNKDFDGFNKDAKHDEPHFWCAQLIKAMFLCGYKTVFTSGRDDTYLIETQEWINNHLNWPNWTGSYYTLFMRKAGDYTPDDQMKKDWYLKWIQPDYEVLFAIDDRKRVAQMWRSVGLVCLHCEEGDF